MIGVLFRYWISALALKYFQSSLPLGTFAINIVGSFLIGAIYVLGFERAMISPELRVGLVVGFLGGFTTFSAYSIESIRLLQRGELLLATIYLVGSPAIGLAACYGGMISMRSLGNG
jgi:CrcB protein